MTVPDFFHSLPTTPAAWQWQNDRFLPATSLPLWDRGFRYGMALFETIAVRHGRPLFLHEHLESLRCACVQRGFMPPKGWQPMAHPPSARPPSSGVDGILRFYVTAGEGSPTAAASGTRLFLLWEPQPPQLKTGYQVQLADRPYQPLFRGLKTANYWANIDALAHAQSIGHDEALLFSAEGVLVSACMANVFLVINGRLHTPETSCGARNGIIRQWVLSRHPVHEGIFGVEDVVKAEEIFLTNSRIGIMPVSQVAERLMAHSLRGSALRDEYEHAITG